MKERFEDIDASRGIAILFVVLGHCLPSASHPLNRLILSFHMPLFFFLSGIFAKDYSFELGLRMSARLLVPQFTLAITVAVMGVVPLMLKGGSLSGFDWLIGLGYWFLPTLFFCEVLYMLLTRIIDMKKCLAKVVVLLSTAVAIVFSLYVVDVPNGYFLQYLKLVPVGFLFYLVGSYLKEYAVNSSTANSCALESVMLLGIPVLFILSQLNLPVLMYKSFYGSFLLFLITSFLGIFIVIEAAKRIKRCKILAEMGRISIAIYVWNFLVVTFTRGFLLRESKTLEHYTNGVLPALTFIISITFLYIISKITMRYTPFIYGKARNTGKLQLSGENQS